VTLTILSIGIQMDNRQEIINIINSSQPHWEDPDLSILDNANTVPHFPMSILGKFWRGWVEASAEAKSAPVDYIAAGLLSTVGSLIGNSYWASPWNGWTEPPIFWACIIGNPSSSKTPGLSASIDLLRELEVEINHDAEERAIQYETELERSKASKKAWQQDVEKAIHDGSIAPKMPVSANEPEKPSRKRLIAMDATVEILGPMLKSNPKGIMVFRDELSGWLGSMNRYNGGGADKPFWLEAYNGKSFTIDRVKNGLDGSVTLSHLSIPVVGGIQPDKLLECMDKADDGLTARMSYFWPNPVKPKRPSKVVNNIQAANCFQRLQSLSFEGQPKLVGLTEAGKDQLDTFRVFGAELEKDAYGLYLSYLGKNAGKILRLGLILEFLWWSNTDRPIPETISNDALAKAEILITNYLNPMALKAFNYRAMPEDSQDALRLGKHIINNKVKAFNMRDGLQRERLLGCGVKSERYNAALKLLTLAHWIKPLQVNTEGRPRTDYLVNPSLFSPVTRDKSDKSPPYVTNVTTSQAHSNQKEVIK
jgi:hypothetical protein